MSSESGINWDIEWRDSKNPRVKFCNSDEFFNSQVVSTEAKGLFDKYIKETNPATLSRNEKGYYKTDWTYNDRHADATYQATYDDQYKWGIMKVPLKESTAEKLDKIDQKLDAILNILSEPKKVVI